MARKDQAKERGMERQREKGGRGSLSLRVFFFFTASQEMDGFRPGSLIELPQKRGIERNGWVQRGREWEGVVIPVYLQQGA